jgi:predicted metal-dependent hydrolase
MKLSFYTYFRSRGEEMKIEQFKLKLGVDEFTVIIKRKNNKHTYIRIDEAMNIIVTTNSVSKESIIRLIRQNENQIIEKMKAHLHKRLPDDRFYYLGKVIQVQFIQRNRFRYEWQDGQLIIYKRDNQTFEDGLNAFYKKEAERLLAERLMICANQFRRFYGLPNKIELSIRKMKSRHGVCYYGRDKVVLNQNLIRSTIEQIDFVIYHELSHFIHPNHSKAFYQVLSQFVPDHVELRKELNKCRI